MDQLAMSWVGTSFTPSPLCSGVSLRTYKPADKEAIIAALVPLHEKLMTDAELDSIILKHDGVQPDSVFLAELNGQVVGTATAHYNEYPNCGTIHMVSVLSSASGNKIGRALCELCIDYLVKHDCNKVVLTTDDFRLPAIKTYIDIGFKPTIKDYDSETRERWEVVYKNLGVTFND